MCIRDRYMLSLLTRHPGAESNLVGPPGLALSHLHPRRGGLSLPTCSYTEEILQTLVACQSCRFTWDPTTVGGFICVPFKSQFHNERKKKQSTIGGKKSRFVAKRTSRFVTKKKSRFVTKKHHDSWRKNHHDSWQQNITIRDKKTWRFVTKIITIRDKKHHDSWRKHNDSWQKSSRFATKTSRFVTAKKHHSWYLWIGVVCITFAK